MSKKVFVRFLVAALGAAIMAIIVLSIHSKGLNVEIKELKTNNVLEVDSVKKFYANLVIPCIPDSSLAKYVKIPPAVKNAWLAYQVEVSLAVNKMSKLEAAQREIEQAAIDDAQEKFDESKQKADEDYLSVEKKAILEFIKNDPMYAKKTLLDFNWGYVGTSLYLESSNSYWSAEVRLDLNNNRMGRGAIPPMLKKVFGTCKVADENRKKLVSLAQQTFAAEKALAAERCEKVLSSPRDICLAKIRAVYAQFLLKTQ